MRRVSRCDRDNTSRDAGRRARHDGWVDTSPRPGWTPPPGGVRVGVAAAIGILAAVASALALEPRLADLGVPSFVDRFNPFRMLGALGFGISGAFVVAMRPRHRVGWLLLGVGSVQAISLLLANYGLAGIYDAHRHLPGEAWAMWTSEWLWPPAYWLVPTLLLAVFPTGRLLSSRWRPVAVAAVAASVLSMAGWALLPPAENDVAGLFPSDYSGPVPASLHASDVLMTIGLLLGMATIAASLAALVQRYRRARGAERQQIEWVLVAAIAMAALLGAAGASPDPVGPLLLGTAVVPLPVAVAVAIVRHGLWDIDVVFSRSLVLMLLTASVLAVYGASVLVLGRVFGARTGAPLVATALVAVGIHPLHERARRAVNRLVYGERDDPAAALRHLGTQLRGAGTTGDVLHDVVEAVGRALRVSHVAVVQNGDTVATWGQPTMTAEPVALAHRGEEVGELVVGLGPGDELRPTDRRTLAALTPHLAVAVHAHGLRMALVRAHQHLLAARTDERQRLRRELHDGLGPTLAALALEVDRGRLLADADAAAANRLLEVLSGRIRETVGLVRTIVDGLRPTLLDERGLAGALRDTSDRFGHELTVTVDAPVDSSCIPPDIELAAYRIAAEAITNAARHAHASRCDVKVAIGDCVEVRVVDDGIGLAPDRREGIGLASMRQRAAELGGEFAITASPGGGTRVEARLPLRPDAGTRADG